MDFEKSWKDLTFSDMTKDLDELIKEKGEALNTVNVAVNEHVRLKNKYVVKSNELRIKPAKIQEDLGLSRTPTEKQQQAYIDDQLKDLVQDLLIADENVKSWKREVNLLDDKISAERYRVKMIWEAINGSRKSMIWEATNGSRKS
ncbi:hypothetical protein [Methanobrevibacter sp.]